MHYPVTLHLGNASLHIHLIFEILAYTIGYRFYVYLRKNTHDPISEDNRMWIFIGAAFGAFLGSHILGVLERPDDWQRMGLLYFMGNKTIVGGFLGGLIGVELTKKKLKITTSSGDLMTYPLILGLIIGRIGCHLEGLEDGTFGVASALPWAIDFGDNVRRHPVNLYEILYLSALAFFIFQLEKKRPLSIGSRFKLFMVGYLIYRFLIEFIKPNYNFSFGLGVIQIACLLGLVYYWRVFIYPKRLFSII
jgi:phosphatidylglycerol---prolipoprotein diacylglyceryl transferase